jgi:hypothetical protein
MRITINGSPYEVYEYDDDTTILERYALSQETSLPSFFRIENRDFIIEEGISLEVSDVRDVLSDLSDQDLVDPTIIGTTMMSYPKLRKRDLGVLWILQNYQVVGEQVKKPIDITFLRELDRIAFLTPAKASSTTTDYIKRIKRERDGFKERIKKERKIFEALDRYPPAPSTSPFTLEEVTTQTLLKLPHGENLLDVFDAMDASKNIPFIVLYRKKKTYYKVFRHIIPPTSWTEFVPPVEGIFFKVLNTSPSRLASKRVMMKNLYSDGVWTADNRVEIEFKVREGISEDEIRKRVFDSFGGRLEYEITTIRQISIKGVFTIGDINLDKVIFADLIATNEYFKYFLFVNEKIKTNLEKRRFYMYYTPDQQGIISNSLALIITPKLLDGKHSVEIRISHAVNSQQVSSVRLITSKLFSVYLQEYATIFDIYAGLIDGFGAEAKPKKQKKADRKTGPRAAALRKVQPEMFGSRYPDQCQKERQPYVLKDKEEALERARELGDPHKVMFFEGTWYACEPREPYLDPEGRKDKDDKHIFPGLKENKPKTKNEYDAEYKKKHPLLPCCFTQDQYEKEASKLRKYRETLERGEREEPEVPEREAGAGYIMGSGKLLPPGRLGELPFNWEKLLNYLGIEKVTRGKQTFYPILRYSVIPSADSIIHCMERAFNPSYVSLTTQEKKALVFGRREELAELNLSVAKQELYDYSRDDIREMLLDENEYLAPELFIGLLQKHYECNIFIYLVDKTHPNGEIVIPHNSQAYLTRDIDELKKTVIIIKYETETDYFPYQCEVVCQLDVRGGKIRGTECVFENSALSKLAVKLFYDANEVFVVSVDGYEPYRPVPELTS